MRLLLKSFLGNIAEGMIAISLLLVPVSIVADETPLTSAALTLTFVKNDNPEMLSPELSSVVITEILEVFSSCSTETSETPEHQISGPEAAGMWNERKSNSYFLLSYQSPVDITALGDKQIAVNDLLVPLKEPSHVFARNMDSSAYYSYTKYDAAKFAALVCHPELGLEHLKPFCDQTQDSEFINEAQINDAIKDACSGMDQTSEKYLKCVESVLHHFWEQKKILYTQYDKALKQAWASTQSCNGQPCANSASNTDENKQVFSLFNTYIEQTKLERELQIAHGKLVSAQFAKVSQALSDQSSNTPGVKTGENNETPETPETTAELRRRLKHLQTILQDLLRANPNLPPSPYLEAPYKFEDTSMPGNSFTVIPGNLSDKPAGKSPSRPANKLTPRIGPPLPEQAAPLVVTPNNSPNNAINNGNTIDDFMKSEGQKRRSAVSLQREVEKRRKRIFELTEEAIKTPGTESRQQQLGEEIRRLNKELEDLVRSAQPKIGN